MTNRKKAKRENRSENEEVDVNDNKRLEFPSTQSGSLFAFQNKKSLLYCTVNRYVFIHSFKGKLSIFSCDAMLYLRTSPNKYMLPRKMFSRNA